MEIANQGPYSPGGPSSQVLFPGAQQPYGSCVSCVPILAGPSQSIPLMTKKNPNPTKNLHVVKQSPLSGSGAQQVAGGGWDTW